jgi:hypothetical protein
MPPQADHCSGANRYGFDLDGLTALSTPIPCFYETKNIKALPRGSTRYRALLAHPEKQVNRVVDGLRDGVNWIEMHLGA